jgi:predicted ATP-grasp superfamily ATP-dependent carboligase
MEAPPDSVQLVFQIRLCSPLVNEISDCFEVVFRPWFKTFAIVENKPIVLR